MFARADILSVSDHALPRIPAEELEDGNIRNPLEALLYKRLAYFRVFPIRNFRRKRIEHTIRQTVDLEAFNRRNDKRLAVQEGRQFRRPIGPVAEQLRTLAEDGQLYILSGYNIQLGAVGRPDGGQRKSRDNDKQLLFHYLITSLLGHILTTGPSRVPVPSAPCALTSSRRSPR